MDTFIRRAALNDLDALVPLFDGYRSFYQQPSDPVRTARTWILNDLYVDAGARRCGVARALLDAATAFAREDGTFGVALETTRDNAPARALYRAAGWHEDDTQWYSVPTT